MIQDGDGAGDKENEKMAVLFITFGLKKRLPVFGRAEGDKVVYNKVGEAAVETMQREMKRNAKCGG